MKKYIFILAIVIIFIPFYLFIKGWNDNKKPQIELVKFSPEKTTYDVGEEVNLYVKIQLPWHLELQDIKVILPNDVLPVVNHKYQEKIVLNDFKIVEFETIITAVKQLQLDSFKLRLLIQGQEHFDLTVNKLISFIENEATLPAQLSLIKNVKLIIPKVRNKVSIIWLTIAIILSFCIFVLLLRHFKRTKIPSPYKIALTKLIKVDNENDIQFFDDIISHYLDSQFGTNLVCLTNKEKVGVVENLDIIKEHKESLLLFYKTAEDLKFSPYFTNKKTNLSCERLIEIITIIDKNKEKK